MARQRHKYFPSAFSILLGCRKQLIQQHSKPVPARRPRLPVIRQPEMVVLREPGFENDVWKGSVDVRARAAAVACVDAEGFAEQLFYQGFVGVCGGERERGEGLVGGLDGAFVGGSGALDV